jgi:hypothetical protein
VSVCVCVCQCMHTYTDEYIHTHVCVCEHKHTHAYTYTHTHMSIYIHTYRGQRSWSTMRLYGLLLLTLLLAPIHIGADTPGQAAGTSCDLKSLQHASNALLIRSLLTLLGLF